MARRQPTSGDEADGNRKPAPTIYDIARTTGFSPSTVSRALSRPGRISVATERKIRDAADELGYHINPMARALLTGRTSTVALILSDITNPVYFDLVRGAERVTAEHGYTLVLAESQESAEVELATLERLQPSVDGFVLVASRLDDDQIHAFAASKPLVTVNRAVSDVPGLVPDPRPGIVGALDHLAGLGHERLAYISGPPASSMNRLRWETLIEEAPPRGLTVVEIGPATPTIAGGQEVLRRILAAGVTAVITYNDLMAIGLQQTCQAAGMDIPADLSIVGFDDIFGANLTSPPITTIRSPLGEAGDSAVRILLAEAGAVPNTSRDPLLTVFIPRGSTGSHSAPQQRP